MPKNNTSARRRRFVDGRRDRTAIYYDKRYQRRCHAITGSVVAQQADFGRGDMFLLKRGRAPSLFLVVAVAPSFLRRRQLPTFRHLSLPAI